MNMITSLWIIAKPVGIIFNPFLSMSLFFWNFQRKFLFNLHHDLVSISQYHLWPFTANVRRYFKLSISILTTVISDEPDKVHLVRRFCFVSIRAEESCERILSSLYSAIDCLRGRVIFRVLVVLKAAFDESGLAKRMYRQVFVWFLRIRSYKGNTSWLRNFWMSFTSTALT